MKSMFRRSVPLCILGAGLLLAAGCEEKKQEPAEPAKPNVLTRATGKASLLNCENNLRQIGAAIQMFSTMNDEKLPASLSELDLPSKIFNCPAGGAGAFVLLRPSASLSGLRQAASVTPVVIEKPGNHPGSIAVLYADGHVAVVPDQGAKSVAEAEKALTSGIR